MKNRSLSLVFIFLIFLLSTSSRASHILGGEITWECIKTGADAGKFIFTGRLYRACYQGAAGAPTTMSVNNPLYASYGGIATISMVRVKQITLGSSCYDPSKQIQCGLLISSGAPAVEENIYVSAPVQLNGVPSTTGSSFYWASCCRPGTSTMINILSGAYYIRSVMYPYVPTCGTQALSLGSTQTGPTCYDSSPHLAAIPAPYVCGKQPLSLSYECYDFENDSIRYDWAHSMLSATNPVTYKTNYSLTKQFPNYSHDTLNIDPVLDSNTGIITSYVNSPIGGGYHNLGIKNSSFRNGQKITEVYRDMVFSVINCDTIPSSPSVTNSSAPSLSFKESSASIFQPTFQKTYYAGDYIELDIRSLDAGFLPTAPVSAQSVDLYSYGIAMASEVNNTTNCLTPPCAFLDSVNPAWNSGIFIDTTFLIVKFKWNTSCMNLQDETKLNGYKSRTFDFYINSTDNWCPFPQTSTKKISITLIDTTIGKIPLDTLDASMGGAYLTWPFQTGSKKIHKRDSTTLPWSFVSNIISPPFYDAGSSTNMRPIHYKVESDNSGACNILGFDYRSIHLDANKVGKIPHLKWNWPYSGNFILSGKYYVYRFDTLPNWRLLDSLPYGVTGYTDVSPAYNTVLEYKIVSQDCNDLTAISNIDTLSIDSVFPGSTGSTGTTGSTGSTGSTGPTSSVGKVAYDYGINFYPNPVQNRLYINLVDNYHRWLLSVYDTDGRKIQEVVVENSINEIDVSAWEGGIYILQFENEIGDLLHKKLVKSK